MVPRNIVLWWVIKDDTTDKEGRQRRQYYNI